MANITLRVFGIIIVSLIFCATQSHASKLKKYQMSLGDRTYKFGLRGHLQMVAYLAPSGALYYVDATSGTSVDTGSWKLVENDKKTGICITAGFFKGRPVTKCYSARRFRSFLTDWKGNPLGLRPGRKMSASRAFNPSYGALKRRLK